MADAMTSCIAVGTRGLVRQGVSTLMADDERKQMTLYRSKPSVIEAVQHTGDFVALQQFAGDKVKIGEEPGDGKLMLLAGVDGAQEWVPVPVGHWLVNQPGDKSDIWPVEAGYFEGKYEAVDENNPTSIPELAALCRLKCGQPAQSDDGRVCGESKIGDDGLSFTFCGRHFAVAMGSY